LGLSCGLDSAAGGMRAKAAASGETNSWLGCKETCFDDEAGNYPWLHQVNL
jgi:hypothetical protein